MRVAVVGGGISGAAGAYRLRRSLGADAEILLVEQTARLGGKLRTDSLAGQPFDMGAEAFLVRRPEAVDLAGELGMRLVHPSGASSTVRAGGATVPLPPGTFMGVPRSADGVAGVLSEDGFRQVSAEQGKPAIAFDGEDISVGALLRERFGPELVERLVDPLLGGVYAGSADSLGLRATMPTLASALDSGADSVSAAVRGLIPETPDPAPVFGTPPGGLENLVHRLVEASGARPRLECTVRALHRQQGGWRLELGAAARAHAPEDGVLDVDAVLLAVPAPAARKLLEPVAPSAGAAFAAIDVASMAVVGLALPPGTALPDAAGVLIGARERHANGDPFTAKAFTFSSRKWTHYGDGQVLLRGSVGKYGEPGALRFDDDELVRLVREDLAELTGIREYPVQAVVTRWGGGLPQYGVGHLDEVARIERAVAELPGLAVAGAALHGVGVPACIGTAEAAADQLAAELAASRG
ncbi:MAG: protoporphyrinogen oxidase [Pseudonocardiaceae bacterium]|nr:protoporphyrinogen oxidase [Pseudonocardiaceae bacterium]